MGELRKPDESRAPGAFGAEEPSSFCSRETPAVPVSKELLLEVLGMGAPGEENHAVDRSRDGKQVSSGPEPAARLGPASSPPVSASRRSPATEEEFWDKPPAYSLPPRSLWPRSLWPHSARPKPSARRLRLAWLLFVLILVPVVLLFAYVLSITYGIGWLDVTARLR